MLGFLKCLLPTFGVFSQPYIQGRLRNVVRPCGGMFGHSFHQGVYYFKLQVVTISTWTVAVKDGFDSMNPRSTEFALETIEPDPQSSCTIVDQVLSVNCLKKLSSEILFLYFCEKPPNWIFGPTRRSQIRWKSHL